MWTEFTTRDDAPLIAGRRAGEGPPVLLLHGGPGLGFEYLHGLAEELAEENDVAWYQQRGLEPSAAEGPYSVALDVDDARRVLDALGWERAYVAGHSWGGHLALHLAEALPDRLLGVLAVDPLGAVGDGRWQEFDEEMLRRTPADVRERAREIDELSMAGQTDEEVALQGLRLVWPAYFADPEHAPPMPDLRLAPGRSGEMLPSIREELPALEAGLPGIRLPVGFVHGARSPMPLAASTDAAERIPGAWVEVAEGAGHFVWHEAPGAVRAALRRLTGLAPPRWARRRLEDAGLRRRGDSVDARNVPGADSWINATGEAAVTYHVATVDELQDIDYRQDTHMRPVRHHFGITAFGTNAWTAARVGDRLMPEHEEDEGSEELYVVLRGRARFEIDGDTVDAPQGTLVFVPPLVTRTAYAEEPHTVVLAVGSTVGKPYEAGGWEVWAEFHPAYEAGDYVGVVERGRSALEASGYATPLYNLACCEAFTGQTEEAIEHLRVAFERRPSLREIALEDSDLDPLRNERAFIRLFSASADERG